MIIVVLTAALLLAGPVSWAAAQPRAEEAVLKLSTAEEVALSHNRLVKIARLEAQRAARAVDVLRTNKRPALNVNVASGGLLAPLEFTFAQGSFGTFPATGPIPFQDTTVVSPRSLATGLLFTALQPLTQLRRINIGIAAQQRAAAIAEEKVRAAENEVRANVRSLYYGLVQAEAGRRAIGESLTLYRELARLTDGYVEQQLVLRGDQLQVQTELARAEHEAVTVENTSATLRDQLNVLLGRALDTAIDVEMETVAAFDPGPLEQAVASARAAQPSLREATLSSERAELAWRAKHAERIPDISVGIGYLGLYNVDVLPAHTWGLGVQVSWEPFDWGRRKFELEGLDKQRQQAALAEEEAQIRVEATVRERHRAVREAGGTLRAADLARQTARERLRVATNRYKADAALIKEVLEWQARLAAAEQQYQQALARIGTARAQFELAVGGK